MEKDLTESYADFPEMAELYRCKDLLGSLNAPGKPPLARMQVEGWVRSEGRAFPSISFEFGNRDPSAPVLVFVPLVFACSPA